MRSKHHFTFLAVLVLTAGSLVNIEACSWSDWFSIGGVVLGSPATTISGNSLYVFARGLDSNIWLWGGGSGWRPLPGNEILLGAPAATSFGGGLHVFARGADSNIYENFENGGVWNGWRALPATIFIGDPAAAVLGGALHVFAVGTDSHIYESVFRDGAWGQWSALPDGTFLGTPAAAAYGGGFYLFARGVDSQIHQSFWQGFVWTDWTPLPPYIGRVIGDPTVTIPADGVLRLLVRGTDNAVYESFFAQLMWFGPFALPSGIFLAGPAAGSPLQGEPPNDDRFLFATGLDSSVYESVCINIG